MKTHKNLDVWKKSIDMVTVIYAFTKDFPKDEMYGLSSQIRRAAVSVPSNIAEGSGRNSSKEFLHFIYIALGSMSELETQLIIANNLNYLTNEQKQHLDTILKPIFAMLAGLITSIKNK